MLKKIVLILCGLLFFVFVGCNNIASNQNDESLLSNQTASNTETQEDNGIVLEKTPNISEKQAVDIAFAEAKKYEEEYKLIITDENKDNYTCELKELSGDLVVNNGEPFYDIIFKDIMLNSHNGAAKTQIGIWVNLDTGAVIQVNRYK